MVGARLRVIPGGAVGKMDLTDLAHGHEFVERVVHGGQAHLWDYTPCRTEHLLGTQMNVLALQGLEDSAPLWRDTPLLSLQALREGRHLSVRVP